MSRTCRTLSCQKNIDHMLWCAEYCHDCWGKILSGGRFKEYTKFKEMNAITAYVAQRSSAVRRGIDWHFNLSSWWKIWEDSGKWHKRGRKRGQYVMARFNDVGPYSPDNVYIATCTKNLKDRQTAKIKRARIGSQNQTAIPLSSMGRNMTPQEAMEFLVNYGMTLREVELRLENQGVRTSKSALHRIRHGESKPGYDVGKALVTMAKRRKRR